MFFVMFVKLYFTVPENKLSPIMSNVHEGHRCIIVLYFFYRTEILTLLIVVSYNKWWVIYMGFIRCPKYVDNRNRRKIRFQTKTLTVRLNRSRVTYSSKKVTKCHYAIPSSTLSGLYCMSKQIHFFQQTKRNVKSIKYTYGRNNPDNRSLDGTMQPNL